MVNQILAGAEEKTKTVEERGPCPTGCGRQRGINHKSGRPVTYCDECARSRAKEYRLKSKQCNSTPTKI
jgi:hypothetical protein